NEFYSCYRRLLSPLAPAHLPYTTLFRSISAFIDAIGSVGIQVRVLDYVEHALSAGSDAKAASYMECEVNGTVLWGVGIDASTSTASLKAIISAVNRSYR